MSSRQDLIETATKWLSLWNTPVDWALFDRLHSESFEDCASSGRPPTKQGFAQGLAQLAGAFPDLRTTLQSLVIDEQSSTVAVRWSGRGTNVEPFLEIGPTNRETEMTGIEIIQIERGQVVRRWGEWDISGHRKRP
jgi:predicted ester cyclase